MAGAPKPDRRRADHHADQSLDCLVRPASVADHVSTVRVVALVSWDEAQAHALAPRSVQFFLAEADVLTLAFFEDMKFLASPGSRTGRGRIPRRGRRWKRNWAFDPIGAKTSGVRRAPTIPSWLKENRIGTIHAAPPDGYDGDTSKALTYCTAGGKCSIPCLSAL